MSLRNLVDPDTAARRLEPWLSTIVADGAEVAVERAEVSTTSGMSNETLFLDASWSGRREQYVARIAPAGDGIFMTYDLPREHAIMAALARHTPVPVPPVVALEASPDVLGAPFLIMSKVEGLTLADDPPYTVGGWIQEASPDARARLNENALRTLVDVHAVDPAVVGLTEQSSYSAAGYVTELERYFGWATDAPNPVIEAGLTWLREHIPTSEGTPCLVWGDARLGNMLFSEDGAVTAALDWENAQLGVAEIDLGWWRFMVRHHTDGIGLPLPAGLFDADATIANYERLGGRPVQDIAFYDVLAGVRLSIMMARAAEMMAEAGMLPPDSEMAVNNPATQLVGQLIGLAEQSGPAETFIGRR